MQNDDDFGEDDDDDHEDEGRCATCDHFITNLRCTA
jgi:hypothetical protein